MNVENQPPRLHWTEIRSLVHEAATLPQHRSLLESYLLHAPDYRSALRALQQLRRTQPFIWGH